MFSSETYSTIPLAFICFRSVAPRDSVKCLPKLMAKSLHLCDKLEETWWTAALTCGDGACALHSVWGQSTALEEGVASHLFCEGARKYALLDAPLHLGQCDPHASHAASIMMDFHKRDLVELAIARCKQERLTPYQQRGPSHIWQALGEDTVRSLEDLAALKVVERDALRLCESQILASCEELVSREHEELVRSLMVDVGLVLSEHVHQLGGTDMGDVISHDPLELFKPCANTPAMSRYDALFSPQVVECVLQRRQCSIRVSTIPDQLLAGGRR